MAMKDLELRRLKPRDRVYKVGDEHGLYIEVHPNGSKLWRLKYRHLGRDTRISFGCYPEVGLAEARRKRDEARQKLRDGVDPAAERKREKLLALYNAANTFGDVAKEYIEKMVAEGRAETTTTKATWLLEQLAPIARNAIADLKPVEVLAALKRIEAKGKHETARRCRSFASRVFRYGVATGRGETDPTSVLRGALVTPKVQHHGAVLDPEAVGEMLRAVDAYSGHLITRLALQISPHVMARPGELRQAQWPELLCRMRNRGQATQGAVGVDLALPAVRAGCHGIEHSLHYDRHGRVRRSAGPFGPCREHRDQRRSGGAREGCSERPELVRPQGRR